MAFLLPFLLPLCSHTAQVYIRCHTVSNKTIFYDMKRCHPMKTKNIPLEFLHLNYQRALPPFNYLAEIFNGILLIKIKQQIFILFFCHSISNFLRKQFPNGDFFAFSYIFSSFLIVKEVRTNIIRHRQAGRRR